MVDPMDFTVENWEAVPVAAEQKTFWQALLAAGIKAKDRKLALEEAQSKMEALQGATLDDLAKLNAVLDGKVLAWATGKEAHEILAEHRGKISGSMSLLEDIEAGLLAITTALTRETRNPINRAMRVMSDIRFVIDRKAKKVEKEKSG